MQLSIFHFSQGGLEFERTFVTFFLGHVLFYRSMETFLVNFLKVFSQDHLRKRLLLNHNANQWYMNTQPNALYLLYPLRCQTETKTKEIWFVQSCAESKDTAPRAKGENWRWCYHNCCKETDYLFPCITHSAKVVFPKHLELNVNCSFINIITTLEYSDFTVILLPNIFPSLSFSLHWPFLYYNYLFG